MSFIRQSSTRQLAGEPRSWCSRSATSPVWPHHCFMSKRTESFGSTCATRWSNWQRSRWPRYVIVSSPLLHRAVGLRTELVIGALGCSGWVQLECRSRTKRVANRSGP
jgi:hypothetical protein